MFTDIEKREIDLEESATSAGAKKMIQKVREAQTDGRESTTVYGSYLVSNLINPVSKAITKSLTERPVGMGNGKRPIAHKYIKMLEPDVVAFLTVRHVINGLSTQMNLQTMAIAIASSLEDEVRMTQFAAEEEHLFNTIRADIDRRKDQRYKARKKAIMVAAMKRASANNPALVFATWDRVDKFHTGVYMIGLLIQETGLVEIVTVEKKVGKRHKTISRCEATQETLNWINTKIERSSVLFPTSFPMLVPPKPWTTPFDGGYISPKIRPLVLVKTRNKNYMSELEHRVDEMPVLYEAVNAVQSTPWKINRRVLAVLRTIWDDGGDVGELPPRDLLPIPPFPIDGDSNLEVRKKWAKVKAKIKDENYTITSKRLLAVKILYLAEKFEKEAALYFPHTIDFRGRLYAVPTHLNPQSNDIAKGLLEFAEGKPVDGDALRWLKIHTANCFGIDKVSLDARVTWTDAHLPDIQAVAADPLGNRWWTEADKPWRFLAACFELTTVLANPDHLSTLPVSVDGTCNGLQNFSAMLRDRVGGTATNLVPQELPQDIYQKVADVVRRRIQEDADQGVPMAAQWLEYGWDRKATKRPVMVLPYGGTEYSARQYVSEWFEERKAKDPRHPFGDDPWPYLVYFTHHVWRAISEVVIAARAAMDWLQQLAQVASKDELPITWTTPVGFTVLQAYQDVSERRIETRLGDTVMMNILEETKDTLDAHRQSNSISPNFVHSMDAAALMLTVHHCRKEGIYAFGMVHDSYGTHAADMARMAVCLRNAFVELYQTDVLQQLRDGVVAGLTDKARRKVPPMPAQGDLELEDVKQSAYFFA